MHNRTPNNAGSRLTLTYTEPDDEVCADNLARAIFGHPASVTPQPDDVLNMKQVATMLHVAPCTVRAIPPSELPYHHVARRRRVYLRRDVHDYLQSRRVSGRQYGPVERLSMNPALSTYTGAFDVDAALATLGKRGTDP